MHEAELKRFSLVNTKVGVIGLGYVGLPIAVEFGKFCSVVGYDISEIRIQQLLKGHDATFEINQDEIINSEKLKFTSKLDEIFDCNVYIITVPTPIDANKRPDLRALLDASKTVGKVLKRGDTVIYESTVYPGCTEEECIPELENVSGLKFNFDFFVGYSPERINPGDKEHSLTTIKKITSGSTSEAAEFIDNLYKTIITAGTHRVSSIKIAEAAKVIENTQRDVNIALINELAILFNKLDLDTLQILEAAGTKWNFIPFRPGLVGGHCIGVDPYYLTHKAQAVGHHPEMILAGRRINDGMGSYIVSELIKAMLKKHISIDGSRVLVMGFSFKEDCPDFRNTRVIDIVDELKEHNIKVDVYDPWVDKDAALKEYNIKLLKNLPATLVAGADNSANYEKYDAIIIAVAHQEFFEMKINTLRSMLKEQHLIYDIKNIYPARETDLRL